MKKLLLLLLCSFGAYAAQSVNVTSACVPASGVDCPFVALPNSSPWTTMGGSNYRVEFRVHNITTFNPVSVGPFRVYTNSGQLIITNNGNPPATDTLGAPTGTIAVAGITDCLIRLERNYAALTWTLTLFPTQGGAAQIATYPITLMGQTSWAGFPFQINTGYDLAWLRVFSTVVPAGQIILNANTGDLLDWEFEGTLADSVSGLTFGGSGVTVAYSTTPVYAPSCQPIAQQTFTTPGGSVTAVGLCQPLDGGSTLTPAWSYLGAGADGVTQSTIALGSAGALTTTVTGLIKGSVNLQLAVTDGSSQTTDTSVHDGAVNVNAYDVVQTGLPTVQDKILGPMLRWGSARNFVPWFDATNKQLADLQAGALTANFPEYWNAFTTGTVSVSPTMTCGGSAAGYGLVGSGTAFSGYSAGDYIVIAWNGGANRVMNQVASVSSNTCIILMYAYRPSLTETGLSFAHNNGTPLEGWLFAQATTPGNYYDNVKAYRSFYERTGIDTYWTAYEYLANAFWQNPAMDQGQAFVSGANGGDEYAYTNRSQSLEGMIILASDAGNSGMWAGLAPIFNANIYLINSYLATYGWVIGDTRQEAYALEFTALCSLYDPDSGQAATCKSALSTAVPLYSAGVQANGNIPSLELTEVDYTNTVVVTNGSTTVTCAGCSWTSGQWPGPGGNNAAFVTYNCTTGCMSSYSGLVPPTNALFSSVYYPTYVSPTQITLDRPYSEISSVGTNTKWAFSPTMYGVPGWGAQPFMVGIETTALALTSAAIAMSDPTNSAIAATVAQGDAGWLTARGYANPVNSGTGGMYYFQDFQNCTFPTQTTTCTLGFDQSQARADAGEATRGLLSAYQLSPTPAKAAFIRTLVNQMFCNPNFAGAGTTCTTDGFYVSDLDTGQTFMSSAALANKWWGFFYGWDAIINAITQLSMAGGASIFGPVVISGPVLVQ